MTADELERRLKSTVATFAAANAAAVGHLTVIGETAEARRRCAPELSYGRHFGPPPYDARPAAVLALFYRRAGEWRLPLMLRPDHMLSHAAQVSLPGGRMEDQETPDACAVREFVEELGADPFGVRLIGRLSPVYIFGTNYRVTPCLAIAEGELMFRPNPEEVAELLEMPLAQLARGERRGEHRRSRYGIDYAAPHWDVAGQRVWGATCVILDELARRLAASGLEQ